MIWQARDLPPCTSKCFPHSQLALLMKKVTAKMTQQQTAERTGWLVPTPATIVALTLLNRGWTFPT